MQWVDGGRETNNSPFPYFLLDRGSCLVFPFLPSMFSVLLPDNWLIDCGAGSKGSMGCVVAESAPVHGSLQQHMSQADTAESCACSD